MTASDPLQCQPRAAGMRLWRAARPFGAGLGLWALSTAAAQAAEHSGAPTAPRPQNPVPAFDEKWADASLLPRLRGGGYVLYFRHGITDGSRVDHAPEVDLNDCATQRVLSEEGRRQMELLGKVLVRARIPVGEVFHSPLCRTRDSARLLFATTPYLLRPTSLLAYTAHLTTEQKKPVVAATRELVSRPVPPGSNRAIVAHAPNLADLMGYYIKPEGTMAVLRPLGKGRFEYVASVAPAHWETLLAPARKP